MIDRRTWFLSVATLVPLVAVAMCATASQLTNSGVVETAAASCCSDEACCPDGDCCPECCPMTVVMGAKVGADACCPGDSCCQPVAADAAKPTAACRSACKASDACWSSCFP